MINPSVVAAIRVVGVRGDLCGAMRWTQSTAKESKFHSRSSIP